MDLTGRQRKILRAMIEGPTLLVPLPGGWGVGKGYSQLGVRAFRYPIAFVEVLAIEGRHIVQRVHQAADLVDPRRLTDLGWRVAWDLLPLKLKAKVPSEIPYPEQRRMR